MRPFIFLSAFIYSFGAMALEITEGPWISAKKYDYRYVTEYEVKTVSRPLAGFPWIEEDCHDSGNRFANWSKSISYEITYGGSLSFNLLGFLDVDLGADRGKIIEFTFQRWVTPTAGLRARHVLHEVYENWEGKTRVEYRYGNHTEMSEKVYPFRLEKMGYGLSVVRKVLGACDE